MFINFFSLIKISAVILSNLFFIIALDQLYELSRKVLKDEYLGDHNLLIQSIYCQFNLISAYKAALFFSINPASIFFSAPYSESLNAMLTFSALSRFTKGFSAKSCIAVSLASATRANSILNAGFVVYNSLKIVATEMILFVR